MKAFVEFECGDKTCASEPGKFCRFIGTKSFGQRCYCFLYGQNLFEEDGWVQRSLDCTKEFPGIESKPSTKSKTRKYWINGQNGQYHREDGPAVEVDGNEEWWINGKRYPTKASYNKALKAFKKAQS